jgi:hypothetical protein
MRRGVIQNPRALLSQVLESLVLVATCCCEELALHNASLGPRFGEARKVDDDVEWSSKVHGRSCSSAALAACSRRSR